MSDVVVVLAVPVTQLGPVAQAAVGFGKDLVGDVHLEAAIQPGLHNLPGCSVARKKGADQHRAINDRLHAASGGLP